MNINDKIRGSLMGGAIGDALGYQIEFKKGIKEKEVTKYNGIGIISDDTQMTLFTANALIWRETRGILKGICPPIENAVYLAYKDWLDTQNNKIGERSISWIKNVKELNIPRAPGNTCISALMNDKEGTIEEPINDSKGCGGVMRVAPLGLYLNDNHVSGVEAAKVSALTHGHPLGIMPSYVLASMINLIVYKSLSIEEALDISIENLKNKFNIFNEKDTNYFIDLINKAKELSQSDINDLEAINALGEGWVAEEALAIAIYSCLKYKDSIIDAIVCSINHDGDSDSTGSIAGNIIGASLGYNNIPSYYTDNIELKDIILTIADDLSIAPPLNSVEPPKDTVWLDKYLYCKYNIEK